MPDDAGFARDLKRKQLQVIASDLPASARAVRDVLAQSGSLFDRGGVVVRLAQAADGGPPIAIEVTPNGIVCETHQHCQPMAWQGEQLKPVTLPERVAKMFLDMRGGWNLPPLDGIATSPLLQADGTLCAHEGYDLASRLWCTNVPNLMLPERPSRQDAEAALLSLRRAFCTFPFGDAPRAPERQGHPPTIDLNQAPLLDETAALAGLLTAVCRPSLPLAPGLVATAPAISGAGAGKGLLVRAISLIAFGVPPRAFTAGSEKNELDKRLVAELIEAAPAVFLDNVNGVALRSNTLASVMTERPARVRELGKSRMLPLNTTAFVAITGNGLTLSEDLSRRFLLVHLDPQVEDAESRPFAPGYLDRIISRRPELLAAALTIWRWGRQNKMELIPGRKLGSFELWTEWVRDPLLSLGCADPVDRILEAKAADPRRKMIVELFDTWREHHHDYSRAAKDLHEDVKTILDPQGRGRQWIVSGLEKLTGTRAVGLVLEQQRPQGKWGATTYKLAVADEAVVHARAEARRKAASG